MKEPFAYICRIKKNNAFIEKVMQHLYFNHIACLKKTSQ